jgi:hypothetical protein
MTTPEGRNLGHYSDEETSVSRHLGSGLFGGTEGPFEDLFFPSVVEKTLQELIAAGLLSPVDLSVHPIVEGTVEGEMSQLPPSHSVEPAFTDNLYPSVDGQGRVLDENGDPVPTAYGGLADAALSEGGVDPGFQIATPPPFSTEQPTRPIGHDTKGFGYVEMTEEY